MPAQDEAPPQLPTEIEQWQEYERRKEAYDRAMAVWRASDRREPPPPRPVAPHTPGWAGSGLPDADVDLIERRLEARARRIERAIGAADTLSFGALRAANDARVGIFKNARGEVAHAERDGSDWSPNDWMVAVVGEIGESANLLKKMRRGDFGAPGDPQYEYAMGDVKDELADVVIYMDLLAHRLGIDLGEAVRGKFNEKSRQVGADVWL